MSNIISEVLGICGLDAAVKHGNKGFYTRIDIEGDVNYLVEFENVVFLIHFEESESSFVNRKTSSVDFVFNVLEIFYDLEDTELSSASHNLKSSSFSLANVSSGRVS